MIDETSTPIYRVKTAFLNSIYATIGSIVLGFGFKIWLAQWVPKTNLALYHSTVDIRCFNCMGSSIAVFST